MGKMKILPPQQLSFDFDSAAEAARSPLRPFSEGSGVLVNRRSALATAKPATDSAQPVVSLCSFREVKEQAKVSQIYQGILSSISHIA
jgi:hypothetical protein